MGGSSTALCSGSAGAGGFCGQSGTYGTLAHPLPQIVPAAVTLRSAGPTAAATSGSLEERLRLRRHLGILNDLWEFKPSIGQWAWMGGRSTVPAIIKRLPESTVRSQPRRWQHPMGRENSNAWTDQSGNFWLFGGLIIDASNDFDDLNDLWEFNPSPVNGRGWAAARP